MIDNLQEFAEIYKNRPFEDNTGGMKSPHMSTYYEFPPVFKLEKTRWKDDWDENYTTPQPLLTTVNEDYQDIYLKEAADYTWICYVEIN